MSLISDIRAAPVGAMIIEPVGAHGGSHHYDIPLCRSIRQAGVDAVLATSEGTAAPPGDDTPILLAYRGIFGRDPAWRRALRWVRGTLQALAHARRRGHQIAHLHLYGFDPMYVLTSALVRLHRLQLVITAHDVESFDAKQSKGRLSQWPLRTASAVIAHNQVTRRELVDRIGVDPDKVHVIRHGDHLELVPQGRSRDVARARLGLSVDDFVVVFFGQIKDVKGVDVLIKEASHARPRTQRRLKLVIAGRPWRNDFAPYQQLIDTLALAEDVSLHIRFVPDEELPDYYCAASLLALPYKRIYQSGVLLMAMALRVPVVVSDLPGMTEMIEDGVNGLVFANGDAAALADKLVWAERHEDGLQHMAQQAFDRMCREHAWPLIGQQTAALYRQLVGQPPR